MKKKSTFLLIGAIALCLNAYATPPGSMTKVQLFDSANLTDSPVENDAGEPIADIEKFLIDQGGEVRFVILGTGGFLDLGERLIPVPWESLVFTSTVVDGETRNVIQVKATQEMLEKAPTYSDGDLSGLKAEDGSTSVYQYWGVENPMQRALRNIKQAGEDARETISEKVEEIRTDLKEEE